MWFLCVFRFGGRPIYAELTPVTDFREACCRQYETGECTRYLKRTRLESRRFKYMHQWWGGALWGARIVNDKFLCCRSGFCNFMHLKPISRKLRQELYGRSVKGPVGRQRHLADKFDI